MSSYNKLSHSIILFMSVVGLITVTVMAGTAHAEVIKSFQKISAIQGGFAEAGGTLENRNDFGESLDTIGDLDGDGIIDLVVGAQWDNAGGTRRGAVFILFMNTDGTVRAQQEINDLNGGFTGTLDDDDHFGIGATGLGDIDGDGVLDIAVGANGDDDGPFNNNGAIWILFLNRDGTVKSHQKISEEQGGLNRNVSGMGGDLEMLGDLDNDGIGDLWTLDSGGFLNIYLNSDGTVKRSVRFTGPSGTLFGQTGALLDDLDGDGVKDLAIGAQFDADGGYRRGAVWIIFLNADGTEKSRTKISNLTGGFTGFLEDGDEFGQAVTPIGDRNGDGIPDIAVGAEHADAPYCTSGIDNECRDKDTGEVWILHLNRDGTVLSHELIASQDENFITIRRNANLGQAVTFLGDLDGDGVNDIAASADGDIDGSGVMTGAVYILFLQGYGVPPDTNQPPVLANINNQIITEGNLLTIPVSATDPDGQPLILSATGLPAGATFTDFGNGLGSFSWTPAMGDANNSPYMVTFRATEDGVNGLSDSQTVTITVSPAGSGGGGLFGDVSSISGLVDLTALGTSDWAHWSSGAINMVRRNGVQQISDYTQIGGESPEGAGASASYSWTNGTPVESNTGASDGLRVFDVGSGFRVTAPADTDARTLVMYVGAKNARGRFMATLSDGSAPVYSTFIDQTERLGSHRVELQYQSASAGQTLTIEYTMDTRYISARTGSQINLESAVLQGGGTPGSGGGGLSGAVSPISGLVDLTALGTSDWAHWSGGNINMVRRNGVQQISDYTQIGGESPVGAGASASYSWTNGTPVVSNSGASDGLRVFDVGSGFRVTAPADTEARTLVMYVGAKNARGRFMATLSDGSAPVYSTFIDQTERLGSHRVELQYQSASAGQTLTIEYTMDTRYISARTGSQINLESAVLN